ncbi:hypothetical protein ILUMI_12098 [Ignelater luminosus]|uniref:Cytochrome P450 n=1 Tax=Ignelater luminosus TaxID=2038154 RepID=A0A8K0GDA9_IGNLU|nr:hypothetical protein ILUMI_12098 [Ignelater luminosus]
MLKDFQYFVDRGFYYNEKDDPLSAHLFAIGGKKWRTLRTKLTPTFTSGKMKMMFDTLIQCSVQMEKAINQFSIGKQPVDIKDVVGCFTTDVIGSCAFGLDCDSFKTPDAEFRKCGKRIFKSTSKLRAIKRAFMFSYQDLGRKLRLSFFPKDATDFFMKVVRDTVKFRKTNNFVRKDMLQILIDMGNELTLEELSAQAFVFFAAGFETSSTTMSFCLYELAKNPEIQEKVRKEIKEVLGKYQGEITYEGIMEMKYMGQVIDETLRKYPALAFLTRECVKDYPIPNTDTQIEKGTSVIISILGLHRHPEYYPDPEKFDPERFSKENKNSIVPFTYIPFGEGPIVCIGMRFGIMQTKVGFTVLLRNCQFSVNKKNNCTVCNGSLQLDINY